MICLEELESLGLIKMLQSVPHLKEKKDDQTFKLLNITERGLQGTTIKPVENRIG